MASKQITPTRMELTKTKKKLVTARRGHKLLKDKRDELMRQFLELVKENMALRQKVEAGILSANKNFVIAKAGMDEATLNTALMAPKQEVNLEVGNKNVMSVDIPVFNTKTRTADANDIYSYGFAFTSSDLDGAVKSLADILPDMLKSPLLTAEWETRLTEIAKGCDDPQSFMQGIEDMTRELVKQYSHITEDGKKLFAPEKEAVGICPRCKSPVYEGKKNFYCSDRSCRFVMWKNDKFFESRRTVFSKKIAAALLKDGKAKVKGLYSERTGKTYDGTVLLCDTGEKYVNYRIEQRK